MFGPREIVVVLIVLVIVLVVFGPKRIKSLGSELGNAIKGFRNAVRDKDAEASGDEAGVKSVPHQQSPDSERTMATENANPKRQV